MKNLTFGMMSLNIAIFVFITMGSKRACCYFSIKSDFGEFRNSKSSTATSTSALANQISALLAQVKTLQDQLAEVNKKKGELATDLRSTIQLVRTLSLGMSGTDVKLLQEILATDPEIYPEGLTTGYFGALTAKAVRKFQKKSGIDQVGNVGPKTLAHLNLLLTEGAGNSGKVPPGFLIAPGIAKKLGYTPVPPVGQKLPPGIAKKIPGYSTSTPPATTTPDILAPVISSLASSGVSSTSATVSWTTSEAATGTVWFGTSTPVDTATATTLSSSSLSTPHSFNLTLLQTSTTYYYTVKSVDAAGNAATSSTNSFLTQ